VNALYRADDHRNREWQAPPKTLAFDPCRREEDASAGSGEPQVLVERFGIATQEITMRRAAFGLICLLSGASPCFAQGHMGTPEEHRACSRDAQRFCRPQLNDDFAVQQCLQQNRTRLGRSCQRVFASHGM
jgi:hypothetical protein